jgi:hypothetical protein
MPFKLCFQFQLAPVHQGGEAGRAQTGEEGRAEWTLNPKP